MSGDRPSDEADVRVRIVDELDEHGTRWATQLRIEEQVDGDWRPRGSCGPVMARALWHRLGVALDTVDARDRS